MKTAPWVLFLLVTAMSCLGGSWLIREDVGPLAQEELATPRIYAYRDWQTVSIQLENGDIVNIRARGTWLYTPDEHHGPEGHAEYPAPDTYPITGHNVPGGVLLGRISEDGPPFIVSRGRTVVADRAGTLYFRINDDILSDNEGYVTVELQIEAPEEP